MSSKNSMSHCYKKTKVKTPTGIFTLHKEEVNKCKAKQICAEKGEVLAPLTNHSDRKIIRKALKFDDDECNEFWLGKEFHIGIDFEVCDGEVYPSTTTGEKISNDLNNFANWQMVQLLPDSKAIDTNFVPVSPFDDDMKDGMTMIAWGQDYHRNAKLRFACLKPAESKTTSESIIGDSMLPKTLIVASCLAFCFAVSTVGFVLAYVKQKRRAEKLEKMMETKLFEECLAE